MWNFWGEKKANAEFRQSGVVFMSVICGKFVTVIWMVLFFIWNEQKSGDLKKNVNIVLGELNILTLERFESFEKSFFSNVKCGLKKIGTLDTANVLAKSVNFWPWWGLKIHSSKRSSTKIMAIFKPRTLRLWARWADNRSPCCRLNFSTNVNTFLILIENMEWATFCRQNDWICLKRWKNRELSEEWAQHPGYYFVIPTLCQLRDVDFVEGPKSGEHNDKYKELRSTITYVRMFPKHSHNQFPITAITSPSVRLAPPLSPHVR